MKRISLLFPGQGSQITGMGKDFVEQFKIAEQIFQQAEDTLNMDIRKLCFEASDEELKQTKNAQIALFTTGVATYKVFEEEIGLKPFCVAGHSLGEYTALACSGAVDFSDMLKIVNQRGILMQNSSEGTMLSVNGISAEQLEEFIYEYNKDYFVATIACYNNNEQNVISVIKEYAKIITERLERLGARVIQLRVSSGFHSMLMSDAAVKLKQEIDKYEFHRPKWKVISNVTAMPYISTDEIKIRLIQHMTNPVKWKETMTYMRKNNIDCCVEIGTGTVLKNLARKSAIKTPIFSLGQVEDLSVIEKEIGNLDSVKISFLKKCVKYAISTPNFSDYDSSYEENVIFTYRKLKDIYSYYVNSNDKVKNDDLKKSWTLLDMILKNKNVSFSEESEIKKYLLSVLTNNNIKIEGVII